MFVDRDAIEKLNKAIVDALRPLGISLPIEPTISYDPNQSAVILQIIGLVGDSAFEKLGLTDDQRQAKQEMQQLARQQGESRVESVIQNTKEELERLLKGEDIFDDPLQAPCPVTGGEHVLHAVEGFCVQCRAGMEE